MWIHEEIHSTSLGNYLLMQFPLSPQFSFFFLKFTMTKSDLVVSPMNLCILRCAGSHR